MKKKIISILFLMFALFSAFSTFAHEVPPHIEFQTITTPHFFVISNKSEMFIGQLVANKLEIAYNLLSPYFSQKPPKTTVIINDKTDLANGYATRIPYPHIMIYPVLPSTTDSLADYNDWVLELLIHEYTHILTFEGARGFIKYLRPLFGSVITPNALLPRWWKEGVAVETETEFSKNGGRLRSPYQDAVLRAFVLSDKLKTFKIFEINEFLPTWPEGQRPYMFGALMWNQMVTEQGLKVIKELHERQAGRVPFFINSPAEDILGSDYEKYFEDTLFVIEELVLKQIEIIKQVPETTHSALNQQGKYSFSPSISSDGKYLAFIDVSQDDKRSIKVVERNKNNNFIILSAAQIEEEQTVDDIYKALDEEQNKLQQDGPPGGTIQKVSWFPDGHKLLYDKVDFSSPTENFSDLYTYDLDTKLTQKMTHGLRAREASISSRGDKVVFVKLKAFTTELGILDLKSNQTEVIWQAGIQERISSPIFIEDDQILFSLKKVNGSENLWIFNLKTKNLTSVLSNFPEVRFIISKKNNIYFSSTKNGIRNIYSYPISFLFNGKKENLPSPITHTYTACSSFDFDSKTQDLYSTQITAKGPQIQFIAANDYEKTPEDLPIINSLLGSRIDSNQAKRKKANLQELNSGKTQEKEPSSKEYPSKEYSPWNYLWPQYWIPFIATSASDSRFILQAQTGGHDPLKYHNYNLLASFDSATQKTSVLGSYLNQTHSWGWGGSYNQFTTFFVNANNTSTSTTQSVFIEPNIWNLQNNSNFTFSLKELSTDSAKKVFKRRGIGLFYTYKDFDQSLAAVSPKEGSSVYLGLNHFLGADDYTEQTQFLVGSNYFFKGFVPEQHAVLAKVDVLYSPQKISPYLGSSTSPLLLIQDSYTPNYLMRGYNTGHFVGETLINPKLEYRFPMREINKGHATDPIFLRRLHGALIADGILLEGYAYKTSESKFYKVSTNNQFWSVGFEFRFDFNLAYQLPLTTIVGIYNPLGGSYAGNSSVTTNFQLASFF